MPGEKTLRIFTLNSTSLRIYRERIKKKPDNTQRYTKNIIEMSLPCFKNIPPTHRESSLRSQRPCRPNKIPPTHPKRPSGEISRARRSGIARKIVVRPPIARSRSLACYRVSTGGETPPYPPSPADAVRRFFSDTRPAGKKHPGRPGSFPSAGQKTPGLRRASPGGASGSIDLVRAFGR